MALRFVENTIALDTLIWVKGGNFDIMIPLQMIQKAGTRVQMFLSTPYSPNNKLQLE